MITLWTAFMPCHLEWALNIVVSVCLPVTYVVFPTHVTS